MIDDDADLRAAEEAYERDERERRRREAEEQLDDDLEDEPCTT